MYFLHVSFVLFSGTVLDRVNCFDPCSCGKQRHVISGQGHSHVVLSCAAYWNSVYLELSFHMLQRCHFCKELWPCCIPLFCWSSLATLCHWQSAGTLVMLSCFSTSIECCSGTVYTPSGLAYWRGNGLPDPGDAHGSTHLKPLLWKDWRANCYGHSWSCSFQIWFDRERIVG